MKDCGPKAKSSSKAAPMKGTNIKGAVAGGKGPVKGPRAKTGTGISPKGKW